MKNLMSADGYQPVNRAALYFRLLPRLLIIVPLTIIIIVVLDVGLSFVNLDRFLPLATLIAVIAMALLGLIVFIIAYLEFSNLKYMIEEHALFLKEGVLEVDTETIPFQKIRNASFYQNLLQRLFHVGDLVIDQDPETYTWSGIDTHTGQIILDIVSARSNIQPISVEENSPNPYTAPPRSQPPAPVH